MELDLSVTGYDLLTDSEKYRTSMMVHEDGLSFSQGVIDPKAFHSDGQPMMDADWLLNYNDTRQFLLQLRMKHGIRNKLSTILKKEFGGENSTEDFMAFCASIGVQVQCLRF